MSSLPFTFRFSHFLRNFNFSSFKDGLFPRPHCSDFFLFLSWLSPQSTGKISTGDFEHVSSLKLTALSLQICSHSRIAVGESQVLLFRFGVEGQEKEMGMTRKISKSRHSKRFFILKIPAYWGNIVYRSMIGSQATSYLLSLVGRAALSFVTYLSIMATHGSGKS